jgi:hypothetical protein
MAAQKSAQRGAQINMSDLITQAEAARIRGVTPASISELVARGRLHSVEMFGRRLVSRAEVESFEREFRGWPKGKARKTASTKQSAKRARKGKGA